MLTTNVNARIYVQNTVVGAGRPGDSYWRSMRETAEISLKASRTVRRK